MNVDNREPDGIKKHFPDVKIMELGKLTYKQFEEEFKKHHVCGIPIIPHELAYDSQCPQCCPEGNQWRVLCRELYEKKKIVFFVAYWYTQEQIDKIVGGQL